MKLKDSLFYKYEKPFINDVITSLKRLDGRSADDYRKLDIHFGKEWGVCIVTLGETKVMAQVTCEVQQPKTVRPNEGLLFLNVEISPMAAPNIEQNTLSELHVHLSRLLEKCIKESHCVDLESLCIVAEEKVWSVRADIVVLNYDGNMVGCSSIAAIAALSHFRRPDVTIDGEKVIIHTAAEKDPIPLSIRHCPVAICYAIFENGRYILADPSDIEERTAEAELMFGMNAYRELCGMYLSGAVLQELGVLLKCAQKAAVTAGILVQKIKSAIEFDNNHRKENSLSCLVENIDIKRQLPVLQSRSFLLANEIKDEDLTEKMNKVNVSDDDIIEIKQSGYKSAETVEKKKRRKKKNTVKQQPTNENSDDDIEITAIIPTQSQPTAIDSSDDDIALVGEITTEDRIIERIELSGDSEEEDVVTMMPGEMENITRASFQRDIKDELFE